MIYFKKGLIMSEIKVRFVECTECNELNEFRVIKKSNKLKDLPKVSRRHCWCCGVKLDLAK